MTMGWEARWTLVQESRALSGGQGEIRKVTDLQGRVGALKMMHPADSAQRERRRRFAHEVTSLKLVAGPGVPSLLDDNIVDLPEITVPLYFVQEWIDGEDLGRIDGHPVTLDEALALTRQLAIIVERCHGKGVVHRDIKPENVLLNAEGHIWLVDFGIAWLAAEDRLLTERTHIGQELGNRFLRLPELAAASRSKHDHRSDVAFVTGILFYLLTGQRPRQLVDEHGRRPHERPETRFPAITTEDERFSVGLVGLFQANFSVPLASRHQSLRELAEAIDRLSRPQSLDTSLRQNQEALYQAAIGTAAQMQERAINVSMKTACDALVVKLRELCAASRFPIIEVSLAGGARRNAGDFYNAIRIQDQAMGSFAEGEIFARRDRGHILGLFRVGEGGIQRFYRGPEGDLAGLIDAFRTHADVYLGHGLADLARQIAAQSARP